MSVQSSFFMIRFKENKDAFFLFSPNTTNQVKYKCDIHASFFKMIFKAYSFRKFKYIGC